MTTKAGDVVGHDHSVARLELVDVSSELPHLTGDFMSKHCWRRQFLLEHLSEVRATQATGAHPHHELTPSWRREREFFDPNAFTTVGYCGSHRDLLSQKVLDLRVSAQADMRRVLG